eukprot:gnl/MRDRNA2_/MRDRNA2_84110_c1_seq2.p1 gnl/MRDRNA2_/MRDRNA2_84110_c1~~gnl/MRDRNA2_/MRDRNA2_84110_c1_seq2.p1  ORF type:complete len:137 (-),score=19.70 gnl/MRDRNA2_/MRDRNA2_84110_c1_seq2:737-1147(-)
MGFPTSASNYVSTSESESLLPRCLKHGTASEFVQGHTLKEMSNDYPVESSEAFRLDGISSKDLLSSLWTRRTADSDHLAGDASKELPKPCLPGHCCQKARVQRMPCILDLTPYVEMALKHDAEHMSDSDSSDDESS